MVDNNGLDIPENNREIALHLKAIQIRLDSLEQTVSDIESGLQERRYRLQDVMLGSLIFPLIGGMLLYLITKTLI